MRGFRIRFMYTSTGARVNMIASSHSLSSSPILPFSSFSCLKLCRMAARAVVFSADKMETRRVRETDLESDSFPG